MARDPWTAASPRLGALTPLETLEGDADDVLLTGLATDLPDQVDLRGSRIEKARAPGVRLHRWHLKDVEVLGSDLAGLHLSGSGLERVTVESSRLTGAGLEGGTVKDVTFTDVQAHGLSIRFAALTRVTFTDCHLRELDLTGSMLDHVSFTGCDLTGAVLRELVVKQARFTDCRMLGVTAATSLRGASIGPGELSDLAASLALESGIDVRSG